MARKKKQRTKLIEDIKFKDFEHAKRAVTLAKVNQIRILIGLLLAAIATGFTAYGLFGNAADPLVTCLKGLFIAVPAYLIGGGIFKALGLAWRIAKFGWFVVPFFPADLVFGFFFLFVSIFGLMFVPVFFVGMNYIQHKKTLDAAKSYLAQSGYILTSDEV